MADPSALNPQPGNHGADEHLTERAPPAPPAPPAGITPPPRARYCLRCRSPLRPYRFHERDLPCCRQCGLLYNPDDPASYSTQPMFLRWRFWLPGLGLAVLVGIGSYAFVLWTGILGYALFFAVSFSVGAVLGYLVRVQVWATLVLAIVAVSVIAFGLVGSGLAGMFCGLTLALIFLGPVLAGAFVGWLLGRLFHNTVWDHRRWYFLGLFLALPLATVAVEKQWPVPPAVAEVRTGLVFQASPRQAWDSIVFYEQVKHEPPWLLTLALPRPVCAEGSKAAVGAIERCTYQKGYLVKQITRREEGRLLAFRVTEQHLHFERDVTLLGGAFTLEPMDAGHTRVVLTTRYQRHLRPAWLWEPMERKIIHTLHGHVLEGMRRQLGGAEYEAPEPQVLPPVVAVTRP